MVAGKKRRILWLALAAPVALLLLTVPAGSVYYAAAGGKACIRCHELEPAYHRWLASTHRSVQCKECHGTIFSTDLAFLSSFGILFIPRFAIVFGFLLMAVVLVIKPSGLFGENA